MMKKHTDEEGRKVIEVEDLSYLTDRNHPYNWLQRHYHHHRLRIAIKKANIVIVPDQKTATDVRRFYFIPKDKIIIR